MATVDGQVVKVGDVVGFKCDIEQYGTIDKIVGDVLHLVNHNGFTGEYIGGQTHYRVRASDCWLD